jgi:hypothetical protein
MTSVPPSSPSGRSSRLAPALCLVVSFLYLACATGNGGLDAQDAAEAAGRAEAVGVWQQEIDESVAGIQRRACQQRPNTPGCDVLMAGQPPHRSSGIAPVKGVVSGANDATTGRFSADNLFRPDPSTVAPGWRSTSPVLPQEVVVELREIVLLDRLAFRQTQASVPASWAREVEVQLSASGEAGAFVTIGRWHLRQTTAPQEFSFRPFEARFARLRVLSRHGDASFVSLGAVAFGKVATDHLPLLGE